MSKPINPGDESQGTLPTPEHGIAVSDFQNTAHEEEWRPPLPPRPSNLQLLAEQTFTPPGSLQRPKKSTRPSLISKATTAISRTDIHSQSYQDGSRETYATSTDTTPSKGSPRNYGSLRRFKAHNGSEGDDSGSVRSYVPTLEATGDVESLLGEVLSAGQESPAWKLQSGQQELDNPYDSIGFEDDGITAEFRHEFDDIGELDLTGNNEEELLNLWKSKRKHFLILSSAGKPIYNRHGDNNLISGYIGVIQTIISFYEDSKDHLRGFTAGGARFVIMSEGPLYLVAISKLGESDSQLRVQLDALYMQILSTLTLPTLTHLFSNRPSTDLRRPLQGTEPLLSALADTFTRGSPPTLLSALECLKIRTSDRQVINNTLLKTRCDSLLYGLIVAGGRLVSVVRPKRHSLHPSDLQLIFNMLFEAEGVKAGGGENWIPLCLPGFNKNGYLYMYVSFLEAGDGNDDARSKDSERGRQDEVAVLLISAKKDSFFDLRKMRDAVVEELETSGSMAIIKSAVQRGRPAATDIIPGTVLRHFLYKSRGNVQFTMPSYEPHFNTLLARRRLLSQYHTLHASVHAKTSHLKVHHCVSRDSISLAWVTPLFELYCIAGPHSSRNALAQSANKVVQWVRREEERVFIIGGAVF
ncbi:MAG: vacuolar fusion mon1 [Lasallia pustulata]|uniref:Vacuolar fusion protein MON1 n=1 Tax=Lasallia pustulata TaxID=136370 RepID=A0A1W5CZC0_9LECA|nr:MAG: vacuolar fusion mon1 [Lasallia pustulata]SLM35979.1 vacuolar fusion protein mon1 [Lasallia pustulata]